MNDFLELQSLIFQEVAKSKTEITFSEREISLSLFSATSFPTELKETLTHLLDEYGAEYSWTETSLVIGEI